MKKFQLQPLETALILVVCMLVLVFGLSAFSIEHSKQDILKQLGIKDEDARQDVQFSFIGGYLYSGNIALAKKVTAANRAQVVLEMGEWVKAYVNSPEFVKAYQEERVNNKPSADFLQEMEQYDEAAKKEAQAFYQEDLKHWEQEYPAQHQQFIKKRLQEFLELTKDVDFEAELKQHPYANKKIFVNAAYEEKPEDWKKAYRAGKEATTAARHFAQQWLKELQK